MKLDAESDIGGQAPRIKDHQAWRRTARPEPGKPHDTASGTVCGPMSLPSPTVVDMHGGRRQLWIPSVVRLSRLGPGPGTGHLVHTFAGSWIDVDAPVSASDGAEHRTERSLIEAPPLGVQLSTGSRP